MFKPLYFNFMTDKMKIDIASIESKLNKSSLIKFNPDIVKEIEKYIEIIRDFEVSGEERDIFSENSAQRLINNSAIILSKKIKNTEALQVIDALRYAFGGYAFNGLHQLYTRQENEDWHPKIVLTEILTPNDINSLDQNIKLYRGCDINEYNNKTYGQAWTTSLEVAKEFAYNNYRNQAWFNKDKRVVLEIFYSRDNVLYSHQSVEFEVVIDVKKLGNVKLNT